MEPYEVRHPAVPASLDGLTILHLSDTHVTRRRGARTPLGRLIDALGSGRLAPVDLIALTGDYMTRPGDEVHAEAALRDLTESWAARPPRLGAYGVFGNHDSPLLVELARQIPGVTWLDGASVEVEGTGGALRILGVSYPEDLLGATLGLHAERPAPIPASDSGGAGLSPFTLTLVHHPTELLAGADLGLPLLLAGHTHGGQFRVSPGYAPHTSSDLPPDLACGILRLRQTLVCVSRGLGEAIIELRINCPAQAPLYTLQSGPIETPGGEDDGDHWTVGKVRGW